MDFQSIALEEGITYWWLPETKWKSLSIDVFCKVPMARESVTPLALVPRLAKRGTQSLPSLRDLSRRLESLYGAGLGADCSKVGPVQVLRFGIDMTCPSYLESMVKNTSDDLNLVKAMDLVWELALKPYVLNGEYPKDRFETEREEHRRAVMAMINDRPRYAMTKIIDALSGEDPRGLPAWGVLEDLDKLTARRTYDTFKKVIKSCPISIYAVGDGAKELGEILTRRKVEFPVTREFDREDCQGGKDAPALPREPIFVEESLPGDQTIVCMAFATGITESSPDLPTFLVYDGILGGFPHSKLFTTIREKKSLAYFADTTPNTWRGLTLALAGTSDDKRKEVEELVQKEVAAMKKGDITEDELNNTKAGLARRFISEEDSQNAIIKRSLNKEILGGLPDGEEMVRKILAVTKEDVVKVAQNLQLKAIYELRAKR